MHPSRDFQPPPFFVYSIIPRPLPPNSPPYEVVSSDHMFSDQFLALLRILRFHRAHNRFVVFD